MHMSSYISTFPLIKHVYVYKSDFIWFNSPKTEDVCSRGQSADQSRMRNLLSCIQLDIFYIYNSKNYRDL